MNSILEAAKVNNAIGNEHDDQGESICRSLGVDHELLCEAAAADVKEWPTCAEPAAYCVGFVAGYLAAIREMSATGEETV